MHAFPKISFQFCKNLNENPLMLIHTPPLPIFYFYPSHECIFYAMIKTGNLHVRISMKDNFSRKFCINKEVYSCLNKIFTKLLAIWNISLYI